MPKERLRRLPISQPRVKWSVGASSRSRCSTSELGINTSVRGRCRLQLRPADPSLPEVKPGHRDDGDREMRGGRDATNRLSAEGTIAMLVTRKRFHSRRLFSFERILEAADGVLNLALYLVSLAFRLQLGVTDRLADGLLDCTFDLLRRSDDPVLSP